MFQGTDNDLRVSAAVIEMSIGNFLNYFVRLGLLSYLAVFAEQLEGKGLKRA